MKRSSSERKQAYQDKWTRRTRLAILTTIIVVGGGMAYLVYANNQESNVHGEPVAYHIHAFIEVYQGDQKLQVPANIGVPIDQNHYLAKYGPDGMSPIHTHAADGVIHIESKTSDKQFTLGEFLGLWGENIESGCIVSDDTCELITNVNTLILQNGQHLRLEK